MASGKDGGESLNLPVIQRPRRKTWFLDEDLVRISHISRAQGIASLWNCTKAVPMTINLIEFKRKRKRAFTVSETALLLNYHKKSIPRLVKNGFLPPPIGELPNGERAFHYLSYYSEDHIWEARNLMAQTHMGRSRKDGPSNKQQNSNGAGVAICNGRWYDLLRQG